MKLRQRHAPLLLLLLPALTLATSTLDSSTEKDARALDTDSASDAVLTKAKVGTKDAPVDGQDGKPHAGPFVYDKTDKVEVSDSKKQLPVLKDAPDDKYEGIPETNDGVMDDPTHEPPKGSTGTEGGVTEKDKAKKVKEGQTGVKVENVPSTPKEAPPLPHSEQSKITGEKDSKKDSKKEKSGDETKQKQQVEDVTGLEKPVDLPDKLHDRPNPVPDSAKKDHLDVSKPSKSNLKTDWKETVDVDDDGIDAPFHSFVLSFTMILFSEVGDKTFLVACLMAMKHDRILVFSAAFGALALMTVLSAVLGHTVPTLIPKKVTAFLAAGLFLVFGAKMLREGMAMSPDEGVSAEMQEVEMELQQKESEAIKQGRRTSVYAMEGGYGGRSRKPRSESRFPTPPRSPSTSPPRSPSPHGFFGGVSAGLTNLCSLLLSPAWVQTFVMTFLGEWGDRSQIATIAMAAGQDYWWVTLGAVIGHACCTGAAVIGGRAIAGKVSMKVVTIGGAVAFLVFGVIYFYEAFYS